MLQDWSRTSESQEMDYGLAQTLGVAGLAGGMIVMFSLGVFNPFVGIPLVLGCGAAGFALGFEIARRRR